MVSLVLLALLVLYFFSGTHDKVLERFGLSQRDNTLIMIGLFFASVIRCAFSFVEALSVGVLDLGSLITAMIMLFFITLNYRRL
jgi:hypothetical protein